MAIVGYTRVSTVGQALDGVGLDVQADKISAYATLNDLTVSGMFSDEGVSGMVENRPGLLAALDACKTGDVLVVYSISRLSRSTEQTIALAKQLDNRGIDLVSISEKIDTTTAAGKMIFRMMAVLSEFERDQTAERTAAALKLKKSKGEKTGGHVPHGKSVEINNAGVKVLTVNESERLIMRQCVELRQAGLSLAKIGVELAKRGFVSRNGKTFIAKQVSRMLKAA